uniref:Uncharacterized protein n=1 Tax=Anopheles atroparvus TaxID=41427 RepID=A0A182IJI0_ANOAO
MKKGGRRMVLEEVILILNQYHMIMISARESSLTWSLKSGDLLNELMRPLKLWPLLNIVDRGQEVMMLGRASDVCSSPSKTEVHAILARIVGPADVTRHHLNAVDWSVYIQMKTQEQARECVEKHRGKHGTTINGVYHTYKIELLDGSSPNQENRSLICMHLALTGATGYMRCLTDCADPESTAIGRPVSSRALPNQENQSLICMHLALTRAPGYMGCLTDCADPESTTVGRPVSSRAVQFESSGALVTPYMGIGKRRCEPFPKNYEAISKNCE